MTEAAALRFAAADGVELFCRRWAPPGVARAALVFVHGFGDHGGRHAALAGHLAGAGCAVYAPDLRGHGCSGGPRGHVDSWGELREDLGTVLGRVRSDLPEVPVFLSGYSLGGVVVTDYALRRQEELRGLIVLAPAFQAARLPSLTLLAARILQRLRPQLVVRPGLRSQWISRDPGVVEALRQDELTYGHTTSRFAASYLAETRWVMRHARNLAVPLLVCQGGDDHLVRPRATRRFFCAAGSEDKSYRLYPGAYHELDNDLDSSLVLADLAAWVRTH